MIFPLWVTRPGVRINAKGRPTILVRAWILVVWQPREGPIASARSPLPSSPDADARDHPPLVYRRAPGSFFDGCGSIVAQYSSLSQNSVPMTSSTRVAEEAAGNEKRQGAGMMERSVEDSQRACARVAGFALLTITVFGLRGRVLQSVRSPGSTVQNIMTHERRCRVGLSYESRRTSRGFCRELTSPLLP